MIDDREILEEQTPSCDPRLERVAPGGDSIVNRMLRRTRAAFGSNCRTVLNRPTFSGGTSFRCIARVDDRPSGMHAVMSAVLHDH